MLERVCKQQSAAGRPVLRRGEDGRDDREAAWTDLALGHTRRHWPGAAAGLMP
jgi:hypothetical protein